MTVQTVVIGIFVCGLALSAYMWAKVLRVMRAPLPDIRSMSHEQIKAIGINNLRKQMGLKPFPQELIDIEFISEEELNGREPKPNERVLRTANATNLENIAIGFSDSRVTKE